MLTADDARVLDTLTLSGATATAVSSAAGVRRARTRGVGIEFHEYRHYQPGDDPRSIDWTVEARLKQLVVRVSRAEGDLHLHVLVDISGSMSIGTPAKLSCARMIAAALSYVAIERRDRAGLATFTDTVRAFLPPTPGRTQLFRILNLLEGLDPSGHSSIDTALLRYGAGVRGPGLVPVVSDFFEPGAGIQGLRFLLHRGLTPAVVQVVASEELQPLIDEVTELVDVERPDSRLIVSESLIASYCERLDQHCETLRTFCRVNRLPHVRVESATPFRRLVAQLEQSGILSAVV